MYRSYSLLFVVFLLTAAPSSTSAQGFSLAGGLNLADFVGDDAGDVEQKPGLDLGASVPLVRFGPAQLRAEGYYRQKGARDVEELQQASLAGQPVEFGIDYIEVPVILRLSLPDLGDRLFPYLEGGPAFAWRVDCGISFQAESGESEPSCEDFNQQNLEETLQEYEQGLILGGGVQIPIMNVGAVVLDARYTRGLSRLAEDGDVHNRAFSFTVGYSFGTPYGFGGMGPGMGMPTPRMVGG